MTEGILTPERMSEEVEPIAWIQGVEGGNGGKDASDTKVRMKMGFQVNDVKKPLLSVKRIIDKGNIVGFGPNKEDNFIMTT